MGSMKFFPDRLIYVAGLLGCAILFGVFLQAAILRPTDETLGWAVLWGLLALYCGFKNLWDRK